MSRSDIQAPANTSFPVLKFKNNEAYLPEEGLRNISELTGDIYPVILFGDGRSGKSYLASRFCNLEEIFKTSDSAESVTEGIDAVALPMSKLLAESEFPNLDERTYNADPGDDDNMHMLVFDCEGGNNAMAAIRTLVNVFGIVVGSEVIFVLGGAFSEAGLQNLGASLGARNLIKLGGNQQLPDQRLLFVVNKNTLKYPDDTLEKSLNTVQKDAGRREVRETIMASFPQRKFQAIPLMQSDGFEAAVQSLRKTVLEDRRPLQMGGVKMNGPTLAELLKVIVHEMKNMNEVSFPSMSRCVVMDGFLSPLAKRLFADAEADIPELTDYDGKLSKKDPRQRVLAEFDKQSGHIGEKGLVTEARDDLEHKLDQAWNNVAKLNESLGDQVLETRTETMEHHVGQEVKPIGGGGMLKSVQLTWDKLQLRVRTVVVKKNGTEKCCDWEDSRGDVKRLKEDAFTNLTTEVPTLQGRLCKMSPSVLRTFFSFGKGDFQERYFIVREGHFIWWDTSKVEMPNQSDPEEARRAKEMTEVTGMVSFMLNRAKVEECDDGQSFSIMPAEPHGWDDAHGFTGGCERKFTFNVGTPSQLGKDYHKVDHWVQAIQKNIDFGNCAFRQMGMYRILDEVGNQRPPLRQAIWQKPKA